MTVFTSTTLLFPVPTSPPPLATGWGLNKEVCLLKELLKPDKPVGYKAGGFVQFYSFEFFQILLKKKLCKQILQRECIVLIQCKINGKSFELMGLSPQPKMGK